MPITNPFTSGANATPSDMTTTEIRKPIITPVDGIPMFTMILIEII